MYLFFTRQTEKEVKLLDQIKYIYMKSLKDLNATDTKLIVTESNNEIFKLNTNLYFSLLDLLNFIQSELLKIIQ